MVEIQTRNFYRIKQKLTNLIQTHPVRLVHPIPQITWLVKMSEDGQGQISRRKSPKQGRVEHLFMELVSFPKLLAHPNFTLEVLLTHEEEVRRYVGRQAAWRKRGWRTEERQLLEVVERRLFTTLADLGRLLPPTLDDLFSTADVTVVMSQSTKQLAQRMVYCLRESDLIEPIDPQRRPILYTRLPKPETPRPNDKTDGRSQP